MRSWVLSRPTCSRVRHRLFRRLEDGLPEQEVHCSPSPRYDFRSLFTTGIKYCVFVCVISLHHSSTLLSTARGRERLCVDWAQRFGAIGRQV